MALIITARPAAAPLTDTPLTQAQWHYGLRRFGLLAEIEAFIAALESTDPLRPTSSRHARCAPTCFSMQMCWRCSQHTQACFRPHCN